MASTTKTFIGFSTVGAERTRNRVLSDIELIKQDLTNHFQTRMGERVMRPDFGCRIWDWLMEPLTESLRQQIVAEAQRVCEADPRVAVIDMQVFELDSGLRVEMTLQVQPFNTVETFSTDFENREIAGPRNV
jgi:phage baseplate assembly protein W